MDRHVGRKIRRGGGRTKGPAKRTKNDDAQFEAVFAQLLREVLEGETNCMRANKMRVGENSDER